MLLIFIVFSFVGGRALSTSVAICDTSSSVGLSPREQRALRRKEKSRLAAKLRRNQESNILSCLLQALPVSLDNAAAAAAAASGPEQAKSVNSGLNLEKSGVIRMAGQTLFLYNSLAQGEVEGALQVTCSVRNLL